MAKYKCNDCGFVFEGDLSTMNCKNPDCGSSNITKMSDDGGIPPKAWKYIVFAVLGVAVVSAIIARINTPSVLEVSLEENSAGVFVSLKNGNSKAYASYIVDVKLDSESYSSLSFNKDGISGTLRFDEMKVGTYYFNVVRKDNSPFKYNWKTRNCYTKEADPEAPQIIAKGTDKDRTNMVWKRVEITLLNKETQNGVIYTLNDITQTSNIFHNIAPGTYDVYAKNSHNLIGTYVLILPEIRPLPAKLSISEMNAIFDKVHAGNMNIGQARRAFSESGDIRLKKSIDEYTSLFDILSYTRQKGAPAYKVISCEYDEENQIVSGSLELERK